MVNIYIYIRFVQKPDVNVPKHRSIMPQINMTPHPVTLNRHWANQPYCRS